MEISIERRASVPNDKDVRFALVIRSLDNHTHGELTRGDQPALRQALVAAADQVQAVLGAPPAFRRNGFHGLEDEPALRLALETALQPFIRDGLIEGSQAAIVDAVKWSAIRSIELIAGVGSAPPPRGLLHGPDLFAPPAQPNTTIGKP